MDHIPSIVDIAAILSLAPPAQPWRHEAPCRTIIRRLLCLSGEKWWKADRAGFVLVARARIENGVRQPTGYDSDYDLSSWQELENCPICDRPFMPTRAGHVCCSQACSQRKWRIEHQPVSLRRCDHCRDPMDAIWSSQKYCSTRCSKAAQHQRNKEWGRVRDCRTCSGPISDSLRGDSLYCSEACHNKWHRELPGKVEARREAYREAAGLVVHTTCIQCDKPLPDGSNARRKYCSAACNTAHHRASKANGHAANGHANAPNGSTPATRPRQRRRCRLRSRGSSSSWRWSARSIPR